MRRLLVLALFLPALGAAQRPPTATGPRAIARSWRETHESEILSEFRELLAIPNLASDSSNIRRNAQALIAMLERRGVPARLLELPGSPPAVLGELRVPGATRTLVLYAHYDGQPVDDRQWTGSPWTPVLRDRALTAAGRDIEFPSPGAGTDPENRLYARSSSDDKASIMAMLAALDAMKSARIDPSVNVKFFFEGEEEAGSPHLEQILRHYARDLAADAWLFCDGPVHQSGRQQVVFGLRGTSGLELTLYGPNRPLHSGHYGNWAPNPGMLLARLLASMRDDDGHVTIAGFYDDVRPITGSEHRAIAQMPAVDSSLRRTFGLARSEAGNAPIAERVMVPALNVRGIRVGNVRELAANAISPEAYASLDFRLVPSQTPDHVRELVEAHVRHQGYWVTHDSVTEAARLAHPRIARLQWDGGGYPASRTSMDLPFSRALLRAVSAGAANPPLAVPTLGGSGPTYLFEHVLHVPMLVFPIANFDNNQHAANENLRLGNLWDGIESYASILAGLGKEWDAHPVP